MAGSGWGGQLSIAWSLPCDSADLVLHPVIHVFDNLPDRVGIADYGAGRDTGRDVFHTREGIHMGAFAIHEFAQCVIAHMVLSQQRETRQAASLHRGRYYVADADRALRENLRPQAAAMA